MSGFRDGEPAISTHYEQSRQLCGRIPATGGTYYLLANLKRTHSRLHFGQGGIAAPAWIITRLDQNNGARGSGARARRNVGVSFTEQAGFRADWRHMGSSCE